MNLNVHICDFFSLNRFRMLSQLLSCLLAPLLHLSDVNCSIYHSVCCYESVYALVNFPISLSSGYVLSSLNVCCLFVDSHFNLLVDVKLTAIDCQPFSSLVISFIQLNIGLWSTFNLFVELYCPTHPNFSTIFKSLAELALVYLVHYSGLVIDACWL